ncbi:MAG: hypothetical protein K1Y36_05840 [Blastocatellia bacterium]|nr:hypothetical protein [Blastocatellia bacterium]
MNALEAVDLALQTAGLISEVVVSINIHRAHGEENVEWWVSFETVNTVGFEPGIIRVDIYDTGAAELIPLL